MENHRLTPRGGEHNSGVAWVDVLVQETRELRLEIRTLTRRFDEFARAYLNARFPYGKPVDRWRRRG